MIKVRYNKNYLSTFRRKIHLANLYNDAGIGKSNLSIDNGHYVLTLSSDVLNDDELWSVVSGVTGIRKLS